MPGVSRVCLEAHSEESEAEVREGDGEPGDKLVLEGGHPTRQQCLSSLWSLRVKKSKSSILVNLSVKLDLVFNNVKPKDWYSILD